MPVSSRTRSKPPRPAPKSPKNAKRWKTAEELKLLLAERSGEPAGRIAIFGEPENWSATLLVNIAGNAERKARFNSTVSELRREFDLK